MDKKTRSGYGAGEGRKAPALSNTELYNEKKKTLEECLGLIRSGDNICFAKDCNEPKLFCENLHTIANRVENVTVLKGRSSDFGFLQNPECAGHFLTQSAFYSKGWMKPIELGTCTFVPNDLPDQPIWYNAAYPRNVYIAAVTPMDENGNFQVNLSQMWERDIDPLSCERIILEVNRRLQTVRGGVEINIRDVTAFYETDYEIYSIPDAPSSEKDDTIGRYVAELVRDGDTIQLGIGSLPNACARNLMDKRDLGIHSEMFTNLMRAMIEKGVITGAKKNINRGEHTFCFAGGTAELFTFLHENPDCHIRPASYVTDPFVIRSNDNMVSINAIMELDLTGQVNSETIGTRQYSGPGGAFDFAYGAAHSRGGRSILIMHSTTNKGESKIKSVLPAGSAVTIPRTYTDYVVTEYGIAHLRGRSVRDRARDLIAIAHPDFREELTAQARKLMYL